MQHNVSHDLKYKHKHFAIIALLILGWLGKYIHSCQSSQRIFLVNSAKPLSPDTLTNNEYNTQNQGALIYLSKFYSLFNPFSELLSSIVLLSKC